MRKLQTAETRWLIAADRIYRGNPPPAHLLSLLLTARDPVLPVGSAKNPVAVVEARVNHGVWQTVCPFCGSAQHAAESSRVFYCAQCMNHDIGTRTIPVRWPRNAAAIEAELAKRPYPRQRNWEPGETITDLRREEKEARLSGVVHHA